MTFRTCAGCGRLFVPLLPITSNDSCFFCTHELRPSLETRVTPLLADGAGGTRLDTVLTPLPSSTYGLSVEPEVSGDPAADREPCSVIKLPSGISSVAVRGVK
jgi:hypothetical protein